MASCHRKGDCFLRIGFQAVGQFGQEGHVTVGEAIHIDGGAAFQTQNVICGDLEVARQLHDGGRGGGGKALLPAVDATSRKRETACQFRLCDTAGLPQRLDSIPYHHITPKGDFILAKKISHYQKESNT